MKYLEVIFGDNDYGRPVADGLRRLWVYVHQNNAHLSKEPLSKMFTFLHAKGFLAPLLSRLVDAEYLAGKVEFATRGVYSRKEKFVDDGHFDIPTAMESITSRYLTLELRFRRNKTFANKWQNGEHAWLDLETGKVETF